MFFRSFLVGAICGIIFIIVFNILQGKEINVKGVFIKATPTPFPTATLTPTETPTPTLIPTPSPKPTSIPKPTASNAASAPPNGGASPTPVPVTSQELDEWFEKYSGQYAVNKDKLRAIAICESNLRTNAVNGDYVGLYQFSKNAWMTTRRAMNCDDSIELRLNPEEAIKTAAFKIANGGIGAWPNCGK